MAIYKEDSPERIKSVFFLILAFCAIYSLFQLGDRELRWKEGLYAAEALEMDLLSPNTIAHGELISSSYPLFPWCVAVLYKAGIGLELGLRTVSVLSLLALAILIWETGRRAVGIDCATVSCAVMISSLIIIEKAIDGYPDFLAVLFIFSGWLSWFTYGVVRGKWNCAWILSFIFCGLAFYTLGWISVFYFIFPLIFMRRPMAAWPRIWKPGFIIGLIILVIFVFCWGYPRWIVGSDIPFRNIPIKIDSFSDYFLHIAFFPFSLILRFLPWSILAWPAFCVAYYPLDKNPVFSMFLRTIFISLFFFFWLNPFFRPKDSIILVPPLALMTGINYWLLVRRHGAELHQILKYFSYFAIIMASFVLVFYIIPTEWWEDLIPLRRGINFRSSHQVPGIIQAFIALSIGVLAIKSIPKGGRVWVHAVSVCIAISLCCWALIIPYQAQDREQRDLSNAIKNSIGGDFSPSITIYIEPGIIFGLYGPCSYLGCKVKKIHSFAELSADEKNIFLIGTEVPIFPERHWENLTEDKKLVYTEGGIIYVWQGTIVESGQGKNGKSGSENDSKTHLPEESS